MDLSKDTLIREEQQVLNDLIRELDQELLYLDKKLDYAKLQIKKAKDACLPDTYGMLVLGQHDKILVKDDKRRLYRVRNELYDTRLKLDCVDYDGYEEQLDLKVGLHTYLSQRKKTPMVISWKMPVCRHYLLDNTAVEYYGRSDLKGAEVRTHFILRLKRRIDMRFTTVKDVTHFYPLTEAEAEKIIADEFLQELLSRRGDAEFRNIVFSIQKQQGAIIQAPFGQNLIVQGCAGSGKSMIMLHRLPIILYDNSRDMNRQDLFIVTPSESYIQLAESMMQELEIEDLRMGTIQQYYDQIIERYRQKPRDYGKIDHSLVLSHDDEEYVYSDQCIQDIQAYIEGKISNNKLNLSKDYQRLSLEETDTVSRTPRDQIHNESLRIQKLLNEQDAVMRDYHKDLKAVLEGMQRMQEALENYRENLLKSVKNQISDQEKVVEGLSAQIEGKQSLFDRIMVDRRGRELAKEELKLAELKNTENDIYAEEEFEVMHLWSMKIKRLLKMFDGFQEDREKMKESELIDCILMKDELCDLYIRLDEVVSDLTLPYEGYDSKVMKLRPLMAQYEPAFRKLEHNNRKWIHTQRMEVITYAAQYYEKLMRTLPIATYLSFMKQLGQTPNEKQKLNAFACSPYLYCQILYQFQGAPEGAKESLVTIDEAQTLAVNEVRLIKAVNGPACVLNMFVDVKQHVEGTKGIDDWNIYENIIPFTQYQMDVNYRNARQITEYCNRRFGLNMKAVNLDGAGVHEIYALEGLEQHLIDAFQKQQKSGLSCIIVKDEAEAAQLRKVLKDYDNRLNDITTEPGPIERNMWNLMTVTQVKGLEFNTVFAISGGMTENEKYIAYTRALDELYVYDSELEWMQHGQDEGTEVIINPEKNLDGIIDSEHGNDIGLDGVYGIDDRGILEHPEETRTKRTKDVPEQGLKEFFEAQGLETVDVRNKNGCLWVIGEKAEIEPIINEAIEKYDISGAYSTSKTIKYRNGWYTKARK